MHGPLANRRKGEGVGLARIDCARIESLYSRTNGEEISNAVAFADFVRMLSFE